MFCKLLILKDKLRITLEWIHSQGKSRRVCSQSRPINGRKLPRVQHSTGNPAQATQHSTARHKKLDTAAHAALHCEALKHRKRGTARALKPHGMRENQRGTARNLARLRGCKRKETDAASTRTDSQVNPHSRDGTAQAARADATSSSSTSRNATCTDCTGCEDAA